MRLVAACNALTMNSCQGLTREYEHIFFALQGFMRKACVPYGVSQVCTTFVFNCGRGVCPKVTDSVASRGFACCTKAANNLQIIFNRLPVCVIICVLVCRCFRVCTGPESWARCGACGFRGGAGRVAACSAGGACPRFGRLRTVERAWGSEIVWVELAWGDRRRSGA